MAVVGSGNYPFFLIITLPSQFSEAACHINNIWSKIVWIVEVT